MLISKVIKVICHYRDASILERVVATFRKLLIDVNWIYGTSVNGNELYEIYLGVRDHPNLIAAILDLSKTVNVIKVEVLDEVPLINIHHEVSPNEVLISNKAFMIYIPQLGSIKCFSWGEECGTSLH